jgi:hypothetical protein
MKRYVTFVLMGLVALAIGGNEADGRGFGGFRGGGSWGGDRSWGGFSRESSFSGSRSESFGRTGFDSFGGSRSSEFSGSRSTSYGGWNHSSEFSGSRSAGYAASGGRAVGGSSYDRSYEGSRGGSVNASGERGFAAGPRGAVAGSNRDVTATGPNGRSYSGSEQRAAAVGPYGRAVGGSRGTATATGPRGTASAGWQSAFAGGGHMSTDFGLSHYSSFHAGGVARSSTSVWSYGYLTGHAATIRGSFGYYGAFRPNWIAVHPGCWYPAAWAANAAWTAATLSTLSAWCSLPATPTYYDYGNNVVIQDNSVYVNGQDTATTAAYATQATTLADKGQHADPPPTAEWKALGVFSLTQGDEQQSNYVFQLAVSKEGVIRGNYYDGLMDTTTPVYGSVDPKTQRAAWTIGKKNDRVFEAGIANLTSPECPCLIHIGKDNTKQWMLVRQQQPANGN